MGEKRRALVHRGRGLTEGWRDVIQTAVPVTPHSVSAAAGNSNDAAGSNQASPAI